jgi:diguanylate cyclase (GGDEF)-like protein/PAS domain S-box-containing protein
MTRHSEEQWRDHALYRARYMALVDSHGDLVTRFSPGGRLTFVSDSYCEFAGNSAAELLGLSIYDLMDADEVDDVRARLAEVGASGTLVRGENAVRTGDGAMRIISWVNSGIADGDGRLVEIQSVGRDVTEHRLLEQSAGRDQLTGLANRALLVDRLDTLLRGAYRQSVHVAVLFVDLDGFKRVNDTLGHQRGDDVLRDAAVVLADCVREADSVSRWGGDEFVAVLVGSDRVGARLVAAKFREGIRALKLADLPDWRLGASVGIATYPEDGITADALLRHADRAMYREKQAERARGPDQGRI